MNELIAHLTGDYLVQSDWMAQEKIANSVPAAAHALSYAACFLPITRSPKALAVIAGTHFVIDRWRLARHIVWAKNQLVPPGHRFSWSESHPTGYHHDRPAWLTVWLMIAADNTLHLAINHVALNHLGGQQQ